MITAATTSMMSRGNPIDSNVETMEIRKLTTYIAALVTTTITFATTFEDTFTRFAAAFEDIFAALAEPLATILTPALSTEPITFLVSLVPPLIALFIWCL